MRVFLKQAFDYLLVVAFVGWSVSWCCGHPILFDFAGLCGDDHHSREHASNHHSHGPLEHDHDRPADADDRGIEKIGIDHCIPTSDKLETSFEEGPSRTLAAVPRIIGGESRVSPLPGSRDGPDRVSTPGRRVIRTTERWLI